MPQSGHTQPSIADLAALSVALERDEQLPQAERARRDQELAGVLSFGEGDNATLAIHWLDYVAEHDRDIGKLRDNTRDADAWVNALTVGAGLILGWAAAFGVFYFDGNERVNVIAIFAILILLPGLFLIPFLLAAAPKRLLAWIPGGPAVGGLARVLSPGKLALHIDRLLQRSHGEAVGGIFRKWERHERLFSDVQKWCVLRWSQVLGLSFQIAAVTGAFCLVVFSDLAFGWSTTLTSGDDELDAQRVHAITTSMATPWSWVWDQASPSAELVGRSRYFRVTTEAVTREEAAALGGWWTFVVMSMLVYGLLPRVITVSWASRRQRDATLRAFANMPGVSAVVRRLRHLHVQTTATEPERGEDRVSTVTTTLPARKISGTPGVIINWSGVPVADDNLSQVFAQIPIRNAGGSSSVEADENLIEELAANTDPGTSILILVKSWEPPLAEFTDFLGTLRNRIGDGREIVVLPVASGDDAVRNTAEERHLEVWHRCLSRNSDPWLRVAERREDVL